MSSLNVFGGILQRDIRGHYCHQQVYIYLFFIRWPPAFGGKNKDLPFKRKERKRKQVERGFKNYVLRTLFSCVSYIFGFLLKWWCSFHKFGWCWGFVFHSLWTVERKYASYPPTCLQETNISPTVSSGKEAGHDRNPAPYLRSSLRSKSVKAAVSQNWKSPACCFALEGANGAWGLRGCSRSPEYSPCLPFLSRWRHKDGKGPSDSRSSAKLGCIFSNLRHSQGAKTFSSAPSRNSANAESVL